MFHSTDVNKIINHLHKWSLRIVNKENISSFKDLLKRNKFFSIHPKDIQSQAIELFKVKENLSNNII